MPYKDPEKALVSRRKRYGRERQARKLRYRRERKALILQLGGFCRACGCKKFSLLEFDHPNGRPYDPAKLSRLSWLRLYRKEAEQGKVRLLCRACNAQDGGAKRELHCPNKEDSCNGC